MEAEIGLALTGHHSRHCFLHVAAEEFTIEPGVAGIGEDFLDVEVGEGFEGARIGDTLVDETTDSVELRRYVERVAELLEVGRGVASEHGAADHGDASVVSVI
jgi:hypothetical protein